MHLLRTLPLIVLTAAPAFAQTTTFTCAAKPAAKALGLTAATIFPAASNGATVAASTDKLAYGFDLATAPTVANGTCTSDKPFFFSMAAGDGDYKVTVILGGDKASTTTVRAESRRLFLFEHPVAAGAAETDSFIVNVRLPGIVSTDPAITTPQQVKLKSREIGALDWDNKLTLEFNGEHPSVRSIAIEHVTNVPTVYIAGDSTVVDQDKEPWAAWGQMLPNFVTDKISIANNAESGETIKSFVGERRYAKIMSTIKKGDYLMIQFAHNDMKGGPGNVPIPEYKQIMTRFITEAKAKGATTILVTAMNRRNFDADNKINQTLGEYPQATRDVAAEQHVGLIDLNAMSKTLYEAMGPDGTLKAFVHYPANSFPGQTTELKDDTHFNAYGAYELARSIVQAIQDQHLVLEPYLRKGITSFNPAKPDALADFHLPASPAISIETPYGR